MSGCWEALHQRLVEERSRAHASLSEAQTRIIRCFKRMWEQGHCSRSVQGWLQTEPGEAGSKRLKLKNSATGRTEWGHPAIELKELEHLEDGALLTLSIRFGRDSRILEYSVGIEGTARGPRRPWYARIDLTEGPEGRDLCSHPLLHAHLGVRPSEEAEATPISSHKAHIFSPRVPLPWLAPWDALEWLMATVDSGLQSDR